MPTREQRDLACSQVPTCILHCASARCGAANCCLDTEGIASHEGHCVFAMILMALPLLLEVVLMKMLMLMRLWGTL